MQETSECDASAQAGALEQRKADRGQPPLRPKDVWSIRTRLEIGGRARDLAMFNLAIDSKLRGCDVLAIRVEDVAGGGYTADRATVRQKKTGRPVGFELSDQTRQAIDDYLKATGKRPGEFLFAGHRGPNRSMTTRQICSARLRVDSPDRPALHYVLFALPTFTSRRLPGAISFIAQARRVPCIARPWPSWPRPFGRFCWRGR